MSEAFTLREPALPLLDGYVAALRRGWSPSNLRDVSAEQLAEIAADAAGFLHQMVSGTGTIRLGDGRVVPRLPGPVRWMWDGEFCGVISLRHVPGTPELPPHVSGHIGYAVVPWKRRRGYATAALGLLLPHAITLDLPWVELTCDAANRPSQKVIEAHGGTLVGRHDGGEDDRAATLVYRIPLAPPG